MMDIRESEEINPNADIKYELFCKWLQQNEQIVQRIPPNEIHGTAFSNGFENTALNPIATEDEVSSFTSNSDDSGSDVFLDTETEYPAIVLTRAVDCTDPINSNVYATEYTSATSAQLSQHLRSDTPSQLSANDFDCSLSDITVHSKTSNLSNESQTSSNSKRKAKHKKGPAPPIPNTSSPCTDNSHDSNETYFIELATHSHIETDI